MKNSVTLHITDEILKKAEVANSRKCMIAEAIRRQVPGSKSIDVTCETVRFNLDDTRYYFLLPAPAAKALIALDKKRKVAPFDFQMVRPLTGPVQHRSKRSDIGTAHKRRKQRPRQIWLNRRYHGVKTMGESK